jgi:NAD(P)-dependent dehydrogenase (short-subunit alcohol dehydrogenase family)
MKTVLITGATSGIGKATASALASMNYKIVFIARNREKAESVKDKIFRISGNRNIDYILADLSSKQQLKESVIRFKRDFKKLDVLINNAGVCLPERRVTTDGMEEMFQINHLSYFMFSNLLADVLEKSDDPRIVNVSSNAHIKGLFDPENLQSEKEFSPFGTYRNTKLLNILFTLQLADKLKKKGISVNALHPGVVRTDFGSEFKPAIKILGKVVKLFLISAKEGAETSVYLASSDEIKGVTGKYFMKCKPAEMQNAAITPENCKILWEKSEALSELE